MRSISLAALLCACHAATPSTTSPNNPITPIASITPIAPVAAPPVDYASETDPPFATPPTPAARDRCIASPTRPTRVKTYDFADDTLDALPFGPRIRDMPVSEQPRNLASIAHAFEAYRPALGECYRWAKFTKPTLATEVVVHFGIDELGAVAAIFTTVPRRAPGAELADCVRDVMGDLQVPGVVPRQTTFELPIAFAPSGQHAPARRPARGRRVTTHAVGCVRTTLSSPIDSLGTLERLAITDFSEEQAAQEAEAAFQRQLAECKRNHTGPCHEHGIRDRFYYGNPTTQTSLDKSTIRAAIAANRGVMRSCYRDALARQPATAGKITIELTADTDRVPVARVESSNTSDPVLDACLRDALAELRFPATSFERIVMHYPIVLGPTPEAPPTIAARSTPDVIERAGEAQLAYGDGAHALRHFAALVSQLPEDARTCRMRVGELRAVLLMAPWIDDHALAIARSLVQDVAKYPSTCLETVKPALFSIIAPVVAELKRFRSPAMIDVAAARVAIVDPVPALAALPEVVEWRAQIDEARKAFAPAKP